MTGGGLGEDEATLALTELARELVGDLASGRLLELALAARAPAPKAPDLVGGRPVRGVLSHPESPTVLYDLGSGHFAEGMPGKPAGPVLHSPQFTRDALGTRGWALQVSEPEAAKQHPRALTGATAGTGDAGPGATGTPRTGGSGGPASSADPAQAEDKLAQAISAGRASDQSETLDGKGQVWSPDRASLHADIVRDHLERAVPVPSEGKAILLGGLGHGKPEALQKAGRIDPARYHVVSTEGIKADMAKRKMVPEVEGLTPQQSLVLVHPEAAHVAGMVASALAQRRKNMVIDGAMADPEQVAKRAAQLRTHGYGDVRGIHVHTPVDKAVSRARARTTRLTPAHALRASHRGEQDDTQRGFEQAKEHLDGFEHWDNTRELRKIRGGGKPEPRGLRSVEDLVSRGGRGGRH